MGLLRRLVRSVARLSWRRRAALFPLGFHGDRRLLQLTDEFLNAADLFVETGTNLGSTAAYVARRFRALQVVSCELNERRFAQACSNLAALPNVRIFNEDSYEFLSRLAREQPDFASKRIFFFLDAHDGRSTPLARELSLIAARPGPAMVLVDDVAVPGRPEFRANHYRGGNVTPATIASWMVGGRPADIIVPRYSEHSSPFHPLVGYVAILIDMPELAVKLKGWRDFELGALGSPARIEHA